MPQARLALYFLHSTIGKEADPIDGTDFSLKTVKSSTRSSQRLIQDRPCHFFNPQAISSTFSIFNPMLALWSMIRGHDGFCSR